MPAEPEQLAFDDVDLALGRRPGTETGSAQDRDDLPPTVRGQLVRLAEIAERSSSGVARARSLSRLRDAADAALVVALGDGHRESGSWRALAADLGIPHQTLHRRSRRLPT